MEITILNEKSNLHVHKIFIELQNYEYIFFDGDNVQNKAQPRNTFLKIEILYDKQHGAVRSLKASIKLNLRSGRTP